MDNFPNDIDRVSSRKALEEGQIELSKKTREKFITLIENAIKKCEKKVRLRFDKKLWLTHNKEIILELLSRYYRFTIYFYRDEYEVKKIVTKDNMIDVKVDCIEIDFEEDIDDSLINLNKLSGNFPDSINRIQSRKELKDYQTLLTKKTRELFTDHIRKATTECEQGVILRFDNRLWDIHKKRITIELLQKYGKIEVDSPREEYGAANIITKEKNIPDRISIVKIIFQGEC